MKKIISLCMAVIVCFGITACSSNESINEADKIGNEAASIIPSVESETIIPADDISVSVNGDIGVFELPIGGMPTNRAEIPTVPHDIGNNWDANIDRVGITGGSAITISPNKVGNMAYIEGRFKGSFPGGSDAGFGGGPHSSDWGARSSEIASTFDIIDGANYFVVAQKVSMV